ncbi:MAG: hypothetical protein ABI285_01940 [Ginsengibacter sp.]
MQSGRGSQICKAKIKPDKVVEVIGWRAVGSKLTGYSKRNQVEWAVGENASTQRELLEEDFIVSHLSMPGILLQIFFFKEIKTFMYGLAIANRLKTSRWPMSLI